MDSTTDIAQKLYESGFSVIPVGKDKVPTIRWKQNTELLLAPSDKIASSYGIGIVTGKVSGNLEVIDIDLKYDLTGKLFDDYKALIHSQSPELLKKLVVQKTPTGGYHFIYRAPEVEGNKKLANRHATEAEQSDTKEKIKVLIETRGEGGYFACEPFPDYRVIYGSLLDVKTITKDEREILLDCAKTFNDVFEPVHVKKEHKEYIASNLTPFDDYNQRGEVLDLLLSQGWKLVLTRGSKNLLLRPGGAGKWSADFDTEKRLFYVFTSSSEFEQQKAYNPVQVLCKLNFNGDYSATGKWLRDNGYGDKTYSRVSSPKKVISLDDDNLDFIAPQAESDTYIEQIINGTFEMGAPTHIPKLDEHWRFKRATLVIANGMDNVGKSILMWYLAVLAAKFHNWKWIIRSSENKTGGVKRRLMEFYLCKPITDMTDMEFRKAKSWVEKHFILLKNDELVTYSEALLMARKIIEKMGHVDAFLIDPYNGLWKDCGQSEEHAYDYKAVSEIRIFIEQTKCSVYLNCHSITEALRRKYPKGHKWDGYPMPPDKADTEGGGKFSNKADDFLTIHRMVQHPEEWMWTEIHVKKIKEMETGGKHTYLDDPVRLRMIKGGCGFEDADGYNPILNSTTPQQTEMQINQKISQSRYVKEEVFDINDNEVPF